MGKHRAPDAPKSIPQLASARTRPTPARIAARIAVLLIALGLTTVSCHELWKVWQRLPGNQIKRIDWKAVGRARANVAGTAREGLLLVYIGERFTAAWQHRADVNTVLDEVREHLPELRHTQVGRVQVLALTLLKLERDAVPQQQWWPTVRPHIEGLKDADFPHFLPELFEAESAIYRGLGASPGVAHRLPLSVIGAPHGPWLEYLVATLGTLADERRAADDETAAETSERLLHRLLREWIIAPGPASVWMLAADLLASQPEPRTTTSNPALDPIAACSRLRAAYRNLPTQADLPPVFRVDRDADISSKGHEFAASVAAAGIVLAAALAAGLSALATCAFWLQSAKSLSARRVIWNVTSLLALLIVINLTQIVWGNRSMIYGDFRRLDNPESGWPRLPLVAAGCVLAAGVLVGTAPSLWQGARSRHALASVARWSVTVWLALGIAGFLILTMQVGWNASEYDRELSGSSVMTLDDWAPTAAEPLEVLQRWRP